MSAARELQELTELVGLLCDDRISDEQFARLEKLLSDSPAARRTYHMLVATHVRLGQIEISEFDPATTDNSATQPAAKPKHSVGLVRRSWRATVGFVRREPVLSACAALGVLAVVVGTLALLPVPLPQLAQCSPYQPPVHVAQVVNLADPVWENYRDALQRESLLFPGDEIAIQRGLVEIQHTSGAVVVVEGPARYVVDNSNAGSLSAGKLLARVSPAASGFVVATPHATIIDLGTEFGVVVTETEETRAHVFKGKVQFSPKQPAGDSKPRTVVLTAGNGIVFNAQGQQRTAAPAQTPRFVHGLPAIDASEDPASSSSLLQYRPRVQATARSDTVGTIGVLLAVGDRPLELTHLGAQDVDAPNDAQDRDGADQRTGFADDDGFYKSPISVGLWSADDGRLIASAEVTSQSPFIGSGVTWN